MRDAQGDPSGEALSCESGVDGTRAVATRRNEGVRQLDVALERERRVAVAVAGAVVAAAAAVRSRAGRRARPGRECGVSVAEKAGEAVAEQSPADEAERRLRLRGRCGVSVHRGHDGDVDLSGLELLGQALLAEGYDAQIDAWCFDADSLEHARYREDVEQIGRGDAKGAARAGRRERGGFGERSAQEHEAAPHGNDQRLCSGSQTHPRAAAYEERIIEQRAQARKRVTHGGLCDADPFCGAGNAAFAGQGVEDYEQVEVDARQLARVCRIMNSAHA